MYINKWYSLAAAAVMQLVAGVAYTFSLYAPSLKRSLHLSQTQLEGIGSAILCGGLFAFLPGLAYDLLTAYHKLGPRLTALLGLVFHAVGYGALWAAGAHIVELPYWLLVISGLMASNGLIWLDTAAIVTSIRNFPLERGSVAGVLKTFLGLSASIATAIFGGLFASHGLDFLLFLALGPAALGLLMLPLLNHVPYAEENEVLTENRCLSTERRFLAVCGVIACLLGFQMLTALLGSNNKLIIMIAALAILAATIFMIPVGTGGLTSQPARSSQEVVASSPLLDEYTADPPISSARLQRRAMSSAPEEAGLSALDDRVESSSSKKELAEYSRELTLLQSVCFLDFWMLWSSFFIGIGSGFTFLNNVGQHVEALGGEEGAQQVYVLLFTTFNCLGRMICGFGSEWLLHRYGTPRTAVLVGMSISTALIYASVAMSPLKPLMACAVAGGLAFGGHWALMPSCTADLFGTSHFAANQSIMHLSTAFGGLLLSSQLAAEVFQYKGHVHGDPRGTCYGPDCFRESFLVIAGLALLQSSLSWLLHTRSRQQYRKLAEKVEKHCNSTL